MNTSNVESEKKWCYRDSGTLAIGMGQDCFSKCLISLLTHLFFQPDSSDILPHILPSLFISPFSSSCQPAFEELGLSFVKQLIWLKTIHSLHTTAFVLYTLATQDHVFILKRQNSKN